MSQPIRVPLAGRLIGYAVVVIVLAAAVRVAWELLVPLVPTLSGLLVLVGLVWLLRRLR